MKRTTNTASREGDGAKGTLVDDKEQLREPDTSWEAEAACRTVPNASDLFFSEASRVMLVDGVLHEEEAETLDLLRRILFPEDDD